MVACLFLVHNGFAFAASDVEAVTGIVALAAGEMDEAAADAWFRRHIRPLPQS
jgi:prophage maintenance system killer protein